MLEIPTTPCSWPTTVACGGINLPARIIPAPHPTWDRLALIKGLPDSFHEPLLTAAQIGNRAPAWQVTTVNADGRVDPKVLERARERLDHDLSENRMSFLSLGGIDVHGTIDPLGCVGVRSRFGLQYVSQFWGVLGRAIVVPTHRGKGLGHVLADAAIRSIQTIAGQPMCGLIGETQSPAIVKLMQATGRTRLMDIVEFGVRRRPERPDRTYLGFFPNVRAWLIEKTRELLRSEPVFAAADELVQAVLTCWQFGLQESTKHEIETLLARHPGLLESPARRASVLAVHADYVAAMIGWGVVANERGRDAGAIRT